MVRTQRVAAFVDGFNIYHALDDIGQNHFKWLNLRALLQLFVPKPYQELREIYYFSAYATWLPDAYARHREYVAALEGVGVTPVMGFFKPKDRSCKKCGGKWIAHEEKETDVNIGLFMLNEAYKNSYDMGLLLSADSDLAPVVRMLRTQFPTKPLRLVAPPKRRHSKEIVHAFGGYPSLRSIEPKHLRKSLFPLEVKDSTGIVVARCPQKYLPPAGS